MLGSSLILKGVILCYLVSCGVCQTCDIFNQQTEECIALPTNLVCGVPRITSNQLRQIDAATQTIDLIEQQGVPVVEGSIAAAQLGISANQPIVNLTSTQDTLYRRCDNSNLLTNTLNPGIGGNGQGRRRRQIQDNSCCLPSPNTVRVLASVDENGRAVQLIQPTGLSQAFQDISNCPPSTCTGQITCGAVRTLVPAEVVFLRRPASFGRGNIVVNICGAVPSLGLP